MTRRRDGLRRSDWKGERELVALRLPHDTVQELREISERLDVPLNSLIARYLELGLEDDE